MKRTSTFELLLAERSDGVSVLLQVLRSPVKSPEYHLERCRQVQRLTHPAIVQVLEAGFFDPSERLYAVMEAASDTDLGALEFVERLPATLVLLVCRMAARALDHAVQLIPGFAHGGVRPSNIHFTWDGKVKLGGFAFGALLDELAVAHGAEELARILPYRMDAERLSGEAPECGKVSEAADVYALGRIVERAWSLDRAPTSPELDAFVARSKSVDELDGFSTAKAFMAACDRMLGPLDPHQALLRQFLQHVRGTEAMAVHPEMLGLGLPVLLRHPTETMRFSEQDEYLTTERDTEALSVRGVSAVASPVEADTPRSGPDDPEQPPLALAMSDRDDMEIEQFLGRTFKSYRFEAHVASGAYAHVFRATHEVLPKTYAIKVLRSSYRTSVRALKRLQREARGLSVFDHPNLVTVLDFFLTDDGLPCMVMEYLEGTTLLHVMHAEGVLALPRVALLSLGVASGLATVHANGMIHRDLKPGNLMLSGSGAGERVKILDFGLLRSLEEGVSRLTNMHALIGTPPYMAPEQIRQPWQVTAAADVYSLGVIMFRMLTGTNPFVGDTTEAIVEQHLHKEPPPLDHFGGLGPLVSRMLSKRPEDRPSAQDVAESIKAASLPGMALAFGVGPAASGAEPAAPGAEPAAPGAGSAAPGAEPAAPRFEPAAPRLEPAAPGVGPEALVQPESGRSRRAVADSDSASVALADLQSLRPARPTAASIVFGMAVFFLVGISFVAVWVFAGNQRRSPTLVLVPGGPPQISKEVKDVDTTNEKNSAAAKGRSAHGANADLEEGTEKARVRDVRDRGETRARRAVERGAADDEPSPVLTDSRSVRAALRRRLRAADRRLGASDQGGPDAYQLRARSRSLRGTLSLRRALTSGELLEVEEGVAEIERVIRNR
ncbi:MAG: protein kinase [Deltaproteobacteria bacterium]|nr:protein kinase [Deltaproteobacteria bacterium]